MQRSQLRSIAGAAGLIAVGLLSGCASVPSHLARVPVDPTLLKQARYVEVTYTAKQPDEIAYLKRLPSSAPKIRGRSGCAPEAPDRRTVRGAWIWHTRWLVDDPHAMSGLLKRARKLHLNRLYLSVTADLAPLAPALRALQSRGIEVYGTLGAPSDIDHWHRLDDAIAAVLAFNHLHTAGFSGFAFDIEPYVLKGFAEHRHRFYVRYARILEKLHARLRNRLPWNLVVPFWFDQVPWRRENLLAFALREADSITIMAYRSHYRSILALARMGLCAGQRMGKRVDLGIEMAPLKDQSHYFLTREQFERDLRTHGGQLVFAQGQPPSGHILLHYEVRGSDLSFYPHLATVACLIGRRPPYGSFGGWIIDGLEEDARAVQNH